MLWQHLFWFFGHPEVYIVALPFFGIITEVIPVFSRKPMFGYKGLVAATLAIAALSMSVWAHHMFATGQVLLPFFSFLSYLIAVPTGMKFFNWIGTMWRGQISFETPMLFAIGFLVTFLFGGLSGVLLASPPIDFHVSDSYFVVAHFHYVLFGTIVFAVFAGIYFWFPKMFGRMLDERLGKVHFWLTFIGFHTTFLVQHWLGTEGMPRRYADYLPTDGFTTLNTISTIGSFILGISTLPFLYNVLEVVQGRPGRQRRRPVGPRQLAGVGDLLPAAAAQLRPDAAHPLRAAGVRREVPGAGRRRPEPGRPAGGRRQAADQRIGRRRQVPGGHRQRPRPALTLDPAVRRAPPPGPGGGARLRIRPSGRPPASRARVPQRRPVPGALRPSPSPARPPRVAVGPLAGLADPWRRGACA